MNILLLLAALILRTTAQATPCDSLRSYVGDGIDSKDEVRTRLLSAPGFKNASILFVGEDHSDLLTKQRTVEILKPFQAEADTCLVLELPNNMQKYIDRIPQDGDAKDWAARISKELVWDKTEDSLELNTREEVIAAATEELTPWVSLAMESKRQDNSVYAVDLNPRKRNKPIESDADTSDRNRWIANDLDQKLKFGDCKKIIAVNGLYHLIKTRTDGSLKSLPVLMKEKGVATHLLYNSGTPWVIDLDSACSCSDLFDKRKNQRIIFNKTVPQVGLFKRLLTESVSPEGDYKPLHANGETSIVFQYTFTVKRKRK